MNFTIPTPARGSELPRFGGECLGHTYAANTVCLTRDGKPWIYRMGELHFSRVPADDWENELRKLRAGGIEVVSSYVIWIHHEETEGRFDFSGNRDLRRFVSLCRSLGMPFFLRVGPWAHGEVRNGGFPDWLLEKCGGADHTRQSEEPYLGYVRRFFGRIYEEIRDLSDAILGIQVENELYRNAPHMAQLCDMLSEIGFRAPFLTATGWGPGGYADIPRGRLLPVYGGYPEAPWTPHTDPITNNDTYCFNARRGSVWIGADRFGNDAKTDARPQTPASEYPYLTCEVGGGNQVTYHRRPLIPSADVAAGVVCRLGSGANGIGYYMYRGGRNPVGKTTMQESRATGYKNDYPIVSYDFQAPVGECGQVRESYFALRTIHRFLNACGETLAPMPPTLPDSGPTDPADPGPFRCAVRSDGKRGFLFFNNHIHGVATPPRNETVTVCLPGGEPPVEIALAVAPGGYGILPFRFPIGRETAEWVGAMPVSVGKDEIRFAPVAGVEPVICLRGGNRVPIEGTVGGVRVVLETPEKRPEPTLATCRVERLGTRPDDPAFAHLQNRDGSPLAPAEVIDHVATVSENARFLVVRAAGNLAAIRANGQLLGDFFLDGEDWWVDVRTLPKPAQLTLTIRPMTAPDRAKIYLETAMPLGEYPPEVFEVT